MRMIKKTAMLLVLLLFVPVLQDINAQGKFPKREMRAVWISTVYNLDWPSSSSLSTEEQKRELIDILDLVKQNGMNAVVFQLRPASDALYASSIEPWSQWLNGKQGKAPYPFYDPLEFITEECHKRNMELHAWLNPFRLTPNLETFDPDSSHIALRRPELVIKYGKAALLDPARPESREHVSRVVADIVRRYDVDAIHMDDYFYPYKIKGETFNDSLSFKNYNRGYADDEKDYWRRENTDLTIKQIYDSIKSVKPEVQFGISPFGVWRNSEQDPRGSDTQARQTNYDDLYADVLKWMEKGWIDYVTPQIYWHIGFDLADFKTLAKWWDKNTYGVDCYIGHSLSKLDPKSKYKEWRSSQELIKQVRLIRSLDNISGSFYFSSRFFQRDPLELNLIMKRDLYPYPAIIPMHGEKAASPIAPHDLYFEKYKGTKHICWEHKAGPGNYYIVYRFWGKRVKSTVKPENIYAITKDKKYPIGDELLRGRRKYTFVVTAVNRRHIESEPSRELTYID